MANIPRDKSFDSTLALLQEGFPFIQNKCQRYQTDFFQTRLMFQQVICLHGEEAAKIFYDPERFIRKGAAPKRVQKTLFGQRGVPTLDNTAHRHRKEMFMSLMSAENIGKLMNLMGDQWWQSLSNWEKMDEVVLFGKHKKLCVGLLVHGLVFGFMNLK